MREVVEMMGGGILFMLILPLLMIGLLALVIVAATGGGVALARNIGAQTPQTQSGNTLPLFSSKTCPVCHRALQADWQVCPYDGTRAE
jgi:hypothetical protein